MNITIVSKKDAFLGHVVDKLADTSGNYFDELDILRKTEGFNDEWASAGVFLLLTYEQDNREEKGEFFFRLILRSSDTAQGGDISCPGGMLSPFDFLLRPLISSGIMPVLRGKPREGIRKKGYSSFRKITLFLSSAVRESWEEIGLSPFHVRFLGSLPCTPVRSFRRIIVPSVGFITKEASIHLNSEVDRVIEIPLREFFDENNYGLLCVDREVVLWPGFDDIREFPFFKIPTGENKGKILWGATFNIMANFLRIIFNFEIPASHVERVMQKSLDSGYYGRLYSPALDTSASILQEAPPKKSDLPVYPEKVSL
ncbi:MAG: NUDIX hydrolase [Smithellaceae bacterium]